MIHNRSRLLIALVGFVVICAGVAAGGYQAREWLRDTRPVLSADVVVGTWRGVDGSELYIRRDGSFEALRIPNTLFRSLPRGEGVTTGTGSWSLVPAAVDSTRKVTQVLLTFETADSYTAPIGRLRSKYVDGEVVLFWFIGDPDLDRIYVLKKV